MTQFRSVCMISWATAITLAISGCQKSSTVSDAAADQVAATKRLPIAVIDLDRIAAEIGANEKIRTTLEQAEKQLVTDLAAGYPDWFESPVATFAEFNLAAGTHLESLDTAKRKLLSQQIQVAQSQLVRRQRELRDAFYGEVSPVAYEMAQRYGFEMVLTTGQVYVTSGEFDITDAVITRISEINSAAQTSTATPAKKTAQQPMALPGGGTFPLR